MGEEERKEGREFIAMTEKEKQLLQRVATYLYSRKVHHTIVGAHTVEDLGQYLIGQYQKQREGLADDKKVGFTPEAYLVAFESRQSEIVDRALAKHREKVHTDIAGAVRDELVKPGSVLVGTETAVRKEPNFDLIDETAITDLRIAHGDAHKQAEADRDKILRVSGLNLDETKGEVN